MQNIKQMVIGIQTRFEKITSKKYFFEIYCALMAAIALLGWRLNSTVGLSILLVIGIVSILCTNNLTYILPNLTYLIFTISDGFTNTAVPIPILVIGILFVLVLLVYTIINGFKGLKMKSFKPLLAFSIVTLFPILWCRNIESENAVFYIFFFSNLGYFLIYFFITNGVRKCNIVMISKVMSYLAILISLECILKIIELKDTVDSIFSLWYFLGWGLCIEAGIMIIFSIPFIFYLFVKSENTGRKIYQQGLLILAVIGMILTNSRGVILFGGLEILTLIIMSLFISKKIKITRFILLGELILVLILFIIFRQSLIDIIVGAFKAVFDYGLNPNGRIEIWQKGINAWGKNFGTVVFGPGICSVIEVRETMLGYQLSPLVFHSSIVQALATGGLIGFVVFVFLLLRRYKQVLKFDRLFAITMVIGFVVMDLYSLIDNIYFMYYFMIPYMILMATLDNQIYEEEVEFRCATDIKQVLILNDHWCSGGAEALWVNILSSIGICDHIKFTILVTQKETDMYDEILEKNNVTLMTLTNKQFKNPIIRTVYHMIHFKDALSKIKCDIIHINSSNASALKYAKVAKSLQIKNVIVHSHNTNIESDKFRIKYFMHCYWRKLYSKYPDYYFACSTEAGKFMFDLKYHQDIHIFHNGIKTEIFDFNNSIRDKIRTKLGLANEELLVGHIGRYSTQKNHLFLIDVFAKIYELNPKSKLLLLGEGPLKEEVFEKINKLGLSDVVIDGGITNQANEYYQAMDVFILPSLHEGLPVVGIEAQGAGLPCVFADTITEEAKVLDTTCYISLNQDITLWAEKVLCLAGEARVSTRQKLIEKSFDIVNESLKLKKFYESLD